MRCFLPLALAWIVGGCGLAAPIMKAETIHYDDVIEDTTNKLLLLNILRARDKAPLHFAQIPVIRESMQQGASVQVAAPFGFVRNSPQRNIGTAGLNFQLAPSYEIGHLNSREFVTGIASPIEPKFVKYWLDRGLDRRMILLLFFSSAEIVETPVGSGHSHIVRIMNSPREALDAIRKQGMDPPRAAGVEMRCDGLSDFQRYLKLINSLSSFYARAYTERRLVAENIRLDPAKDIKDLQGIAALDPAKVQWARKDNLYSLYAVSGEPKIALCFYDAQDARPSLIEAGTSDSSDRNGCFQSVVEATRESHAVTTTDSPIFYKRPASATKPSEFCGHFNRFIGVEKANPKATRTELRLQMRSVGEMIQFLGDLLEYQDALIRMVEREPQARIRLNAPVTFGYCPEEPEDARLTSGCDDVFFNLRRDGCNARFSVAYRDATYSVANLNPAHDNPGSDAACRPGSSAKDHTLEILGVVQQLIDLRKSASDIRATPSVQVVP
jgi:hypothetical protein